MSRFLRLPQVIQLLGVTESTIYRWEREGSFPKRVKIGPRAVGWPEKEVERWLEDRAAARRA